MIVPYSTYLAPVSTLPIAALADALVVAGRSDPERCWHRDRALPQNSSP